MVKRALPLAIGAITVALVVGGMAFATELSPLGGTDQTATAPIREDAGTDQAATAPIGEDALAPPDGNSGQGAARCSDATAHALEVLQSHQATGKEVGNSIAAIEACGTGAIGSESSNGAGPPEWVPGPPPWASAESGNGSPEGANTSTQNDLAAPLAGNAGQGAARCGDATAHALEVLQSRQAAGKEVGNSIAAVEACGTGAGSESSNGVGPPDWVPGPPPWADGASPE